MINSLSKTDDFTKTHKFINENTLFDNHDNLLIKSHYFINMINVLIKTYYFIKTHKFINENILFYKNVKFS